MRSVLEYVLKRFFALLVIIYVAANVSAIFLRGPPTDANLVPTLLPAIASGVLVWWLIWPRKTKKASQR